MSVKISHSKCNILPIGPHLTNNTFHIDNIGISIVEHSVDLGITIDSKLSFHNHINNIICKANRKFANQTVSGVSLSSSAVSSPEVLPI